MISLQPLNPSIDPKQAIAQASARTGIDFDYLLKTAQRESSLNAAAKAQTSSAAGLFQFIDQTWLGMVKNHGAKHGLQNEAAAIVQDENGRYKTAQPGDEAAILALRHDAELSSLMAAEYTREASAVLETALGRSPESAELYMAHFLGPGSAARLIKLSETAPQTAASEIFPKAAAANRSIFYDSEGQARSAADVVANLSAKHGDAPSAPAVPPAVALPVMAAIAPQSPVEIRVPLPQSGNAQFTRPASAGIQEAAPYPSEGVKLSPMVVQILASLDPLSAAKSDSFI